MKNTYVLKRFARPIFAKPSAENGFKSPLVAREYADLHVTVDMEKIAQALGLKALRNKSKIAKEIGGLVSVQAANIHKVDVSK